VPSIGQGIWYDWGNGALDQRQRISTMVNYELPFAKSSRGIEGLAVKGWALNGAAVWGTGLPFTVSNASAISAIPGLGSDRPNLVGDPTKAGTVTANPSCSAPTKIRTNLNWYNPCAFQQQQAGTFGDSRNNSVFGPHHGHIDLSLGKDFPIFESYRLQFRAEAFNLTNTPSFGQPTATLGQSNIGAITSTSVNSTPRQLQFALKLLF
jgi:hypothetical protein